MKELKIVMIDYIKKIFLIGYLIQTEEFGDLALRKKKKLLTELMGLDAREELLGLSGEDQLRRIQLKGDIEQLASLE